MRLCNALFALLPLLALSFPSFGADSSGIACSQTYNPVFSLKDAGAGKFIFSIYLRLGGTEAQAAPVGGQIPQNQDYVATGKISCKVNPQSAFPLAQCREFDVRASLRGVSDDKEYNFSFQMISLSLRSVSEKSLNQNESYSVVEAELANSGGLGLPYFDNRLEHLTCQ